MLRKPQGVVSIVLLAASAVLATPSHAGPPTYTGDTRSYNLAHGRVVFAEQCLRCHEIGRKDAPVLGDVDDWRSRIEQPLDTLIAHAIGGHGRMPARGDREISDQDVAAAVAYVVDRARSIAVDRRHSPVSPEAAPGAGGSPTDPSVVHMFLMLLGKDRWK